ncbi:putative carbohydrate esterase [Vitis vinifera]|uniref:Putative carbohydrate esterase n=1 Tax=Vitis vinifera TaxID=29760 RepID=A0A438ITD2_VITVI|nr:putative carbohydrate esterase [Vitis vinifera]
MSTTSLLRLFCTLLAVSYSYPEFGRALEAPKDIFILAGQSNMAGRGGVRHGKWDGNVPPECRPNPSILRLNPQLQWEEAHEPLHTGIGPPKTQGVGPGLAFANEIRAKGSMVGVVGLVPCAASVSGGGQLRAILWYQGESDTVRSEDAEAYKGNLEKLIIDLRSDLSHPTLLFIQVALGSGEGKFIETVRRGQLGIRLPNVKCVDAKGLRLEPDKLHLTTIAQIHLAQKLAAAFLAAD